MLSKYISLKYETQIINNNKNDFQISGVLFLVVTFADLSKG